LTPQSPPPPPAVAHPPTSGRVMVVVVILSLAVFMSSLDLFIVNLAFPYIGREYRGTSISSLSWVLNGYTIVFAAVLVPAGRWADRVGRRRLFVAGLALFSFGSLLCGVSPGVDALIGARLVQAVGAGLMVPASLSLLLAVVPAARRSQAIGSWSALAALGAALGPVLGGLLVQLSWRWVFWINIPVGLVAVVMAVRVLPESRDEGSGHRPDLAGAVLLAGAVGLIAFALVKAPDYGWGSLRFLGLVAASVVCAAAVVLRSGHHPAPVVELALLRSRTFTGAFAASIFYYAGFGAFVLSSVEFLTGEWHYSAVRAGLAIGPGPLVVLPVARLVAPRLAVRLGGAGRVAAVGCLVSAAAQCWWLSRIQAHPAYLTHLLPAQLLGGAGVGLTIPSLIGAGSASLPPARFGTGSGVLNMGRQVGTVLGVAGLVAILARLGHGDAVTTYRHGLELIVGFFLGAAVIAATLLSRKPVPVSAAPARWRRSPRRSRRLPGSCTRRPTSTPGPDGPAAACCYARATTPTMPTWPSSFGRSATATLPCSSSASGPTSRRASCLPTLIRRRWPATPARCCRACHSRPATARAERSSSGWPRWPSRGGPEPRRITAVGATLHGSQTRVVAKSYWRRARRGWLSLCSAQRASISIGWMSVPPRSVS